MITEYSIQLFNILISQMKEKDFFHRAVWNFFNQKVFTDIGQFIELKTNVCLQ